MSVRKVSRPKKQQLGQFMTPRPLAQQIVNQQAFTPLSKILEPSFGDGAFLLALIERLIEIGNGSEQQRFLHVMENQVYGVELDPELYQSAVKCIEDRWGPLPKNHNLYLGDFFTTDFAITDFDFVLGNPPFGGTFDSEIEDELDRLYGSWNGHNLKKETYSFFIARSLELLKERGVLCFISSDTFLTISTFIGLRHRLVDQTSVCVDRLGFFSDETSQPMILLTALKEAGSTSVVIDGVYYPVKLLATTKNFSWGITPELAKYFGGPTLADYVVCTSGMTVGRNELFVRDIVNQEITEKYQFDYFDDPITLSKELKRARLGKLSAKQQESIKRQQAAGETRRNLRVTRLDCPVLKRMPDEDYRYYNKADSGIIYSPPKHAIFWKDDGDAVLTFKRNGNWYLHGVGGRGYFGREGFTWQLISPRLRARYLPPGYILDSGAPCGFLRDGINDSELWFILGWLQTDLATELLKKVINHTRNIQSKDVERLPYPWWVDELSKQRVIDAVRRLVMEAIEGRVFTRTDAEIAALNEYFAMASPIEFSDWSTSENHSAAAS